MRRIIAVALAGLCCSLAACGGSTGRPPRSAAPSSLPASTSPRPSATPSPTATTPLLTGAAVKPGEVPPVQDPRFITNDSGGAIAFAAYFYNALDWSIATSNPNLLRPISSADCNQCQGYIHDIDTFAATGGHSEGARISAYKFAPAHGDLVASDYVIQVTLTQDPQVFVKADGSRSTPPVAASPTINYLYMSWRNGTFVARGIG